MKNRSGSRTPVVRYHLRHHLVFLSFSLPNPPSPPLHSPVAPSHPAGPSRRLGSDRDCSRVREFSPSQPLPPITHTHTLTLPSFHSSSFNFPFPILARSPSAASSSRQEKDFDRRPLMVVVEVVGRGSVRSLCLQQLFVCMSPSCLPLGCLPFKRGEIFLQNLLC